LIGEKQAAANEGRRLTPTGVGSPKSEKDFDVNLLPNPASQGKPKLGENNGDREYLLAVLRAATARAKLIANTLDSIGLALRQRAVSVEDAVQWAADEGILDLLQFGPPSKTGGAR
jgi:hypothetical protein